MDVFEAMKNRRSIRAYRSNPVPKEFLIKILDAARWAPSAGNLQTWEFIVVKEKSVREHLGDAAFAQDFIGEAPLTVVVCSNEKRSARIYGGRGRLFYCLLDAAAAIQNMLLAAHALGLGACWIGAFNDERVVKILNLPSEIRPIAIVPLGYPDETPLPPSRIKLKELIHLNRY